MAEIDSKTKSKIERLLFDSGLEPLPVPSETIEHWAGVLPDILIEVWRTYGFIPLAEGRLQLINPQYLMPILSFILEGDSDLDGDTYPIAYDKLGEIIVWSERHGVGFLNTLSWELQMAFLLEATPPPSDKQIIDYVLNLYPGHIDAYDAQNQPVYQKLVEKFGPLPLGEIYGYTPVPKPPGPVILDNFVEADLIDWLEAYYANIAVNIVTSYDEDPIIKRHVGKPWPPGKSAAPRKE